MIDARAIRRTAALVMLLAAAPAAAARADAGSIGDSSTGTAIRLERAEVRGR